MTFHNNKKKFKDEIAQGEYEEYRSLIIQSLETEIFALKHLLNAERFEKSRMQKENLENRKVKELFFAVFDKDGSGAITEMPEHRCESLGVFSNDENCEKAIKKYLEDLNDMFEEETEKYEFVEFKDGYIIDKNDNSIKEVPDTVSIDNVKFIIYDKKKDELFGYFFSVGSIIDEYKDFYVLTNIF